MLDLIMSSPHAAGQLYDGMGDKEPPRTVERKRKGRMVDVVSFLPTPPRTRDTRHDPSPQRSASKPAAVRRRPGLTFAQQMSQHGPGVGMGGEKRTALIPAAPIIPQTDNPFLVSSVTPPSPSETPIKLQKVHFNPTALPSPPPTERVRRIVYKKPTLPVDQESNPFYCPPGQASTSASASALAKAQRQQARQRMEESATITYVHRGSKRVFANPFYPSSLQHPQSSLPEHDQDYSPHPNPEPRLLFPDPPPVHVNDEDAEDLVAVPRRLFGLKRVADDLSNEKSSKRVRGTL